MAASTGLSALGPSLRTSQATKRARVCTLNSPGLQLFAQWAACSSAAPASALNSCWWRGFGSASATTRYSHADSRSWYQLSRGLLMRSGYQTSLHCAWLRIHRWDAAPSNLKVSATVLALG